MPFIAGADARWWRWRIAVTGAIVATTIIAAAGQDRATSRVRGEREIAPDYSVVFALDRVHELRISIPGERFQQMQTNLASLGRGRGAGPGARGGMMPGLPPDGLAMAAALQESILQCGGKPAGA